MLNPTFLHSVGSNDNEVKKKKQAVSNLNKQLRKSMLLLVGGAFNAMENSKVYENISCDDDTEIHIAVSRNHVAATQPNRCCTLLLP